MKVIIEKSTLQWALEQCENNNIKKEKIELIQDWLNNKKTPTFNKVDELSKSTGIPFGYFFLKEPPEEDLKLIEYRTIDSQEMRMPSRNLIETIHDMEMIQNWIKQDALGKHRAPLQFVGAKGIKRETVTFAEYIRNILGIKANWFKERKNVNESFKYIRDKVSNAGITVMLSGIVKNNTRRSLLIDEFRGFALVDNVAPLVFINNNDSQNGKLFTLVHECIHIFLGESSLYNDRSGDSKKISRNEVFCNAVAAELLVPMSNFLDKWNYLSNESIDVKINSISNYFNCGSVVIARRALDMGYINEQDYNRIKKQAINNYYKQIEKRKQNQGGHFYNSMANRIDRHFLFNIVNSIKKGNTLYSDAFRLTNTNQSTFDRLIQSAGGGQN